MDPSDLAWILAAFALVSLMFPGLSLLYGGMLGAQHVLNTFMMVMGSLGIIGLVYVLYGHGLVLGNSVGGWGIIGNPVEYFGFRNVMEDDGAGGMMWAGFYVLFAAISLALMSSGAAGRMRFGAWLVFAVLWFTFVYAPLAHWVFAISDPDSGYVGGWMKNIVDFHDFAGGTAVHMNAGASGLALAMVLGRRHTMSVRPHNLPLILIGSGMIIAGWFGFNGGTAGGANFLASYVVVTSLLAAGGGMMGAFLVERFFNGKATFFGAMTGTIAGLVAITPAADAVSPIGAYIVGFLGAAMAFWAISWKKYHKVDDTFDVFAVHGMAGIAGALFVMLFANPQAPAGLAGIFYGGELSLLWREPLAIIVTLSYAFGVTWIIAKVLSKVMKIRITSEAEYEGIDRAEHAESAYHLNANGVGSTSRTTFGSDIPEEVVPGAGKVGVDKQAPKLAEPQS
ncbi:Ammonia channel [Corynebacterium deserti GIMN1.010]|uniref:Ammonium transporter n=1 Tax=Corynebacterium deserti GIMN1.010 TaxID=931089 RepID=A0A0M5IG74_9CORY|nr:ammonium transporter [Corynebacterium deserti]ALC05986.1 Ammonia channel [Corynebacterium deserti GIMN1.010]